MCICSFVECFKTVFKDQLDNLMSAEEQNWLIDILKREFEVEEIDGKEIVYKFNLMGMYSFQIFLSNSKILLQATNSTIFTYLTIKYLNGFPEVCLSTSDIRY